MLKLQKLSESIQNVNNVLPDNWTQIMYGDDVEIASVDICISITKKKEDYFIDSFALTDLAKSIIFINDTKDNIDKSISYATKLARQYQNDMNKIIE